MPIATNIEVPRKPAEASQPWTIKRLFPFSGTATVITKTFNQFEIFCAFALFITGLGELIGRDFTWYWYIILIINLCGAFALRYIDKQYERRSISGGVQKAQSDVRKEL